MSLIQGLFYWINKGLKITKKDLCDNSNPAPSGAHTTTVGRSATRAESRSTAVTFPEACSSPSRSKTISPRFGFRRFPCLLVFGFTLCGSEFDAGDRTKGGEGFVEFFLVAHDDDRDFIGVHVFPRDPEGVVLCDGLGADDIGF